MKSLVSIVNFTEDPIDLGDGYIFPAGVPVVVYRNRNYFITGERYGKLCYYLSTNALVGFSFSNNANTSEESIVTANQLNNESKQPDNSYTTDYAWNIATCKDMLDGFQKQLNQFDWTVPEVTVNRVDVIRKADGVISLLAANYLSDAANEIKTVDPDPDGNFLDAGNLGKFAALFDSAMTPIEV